MSKALVIYHANCMDGFGAAFAFWLYAAQDYEEVKYHEGVYGDSPPAVDKNTEVFILDFSYSPETLCNLADDAHSVKVLDHHKTAKESWDTFKSTHDYPDNLGVEFDMSRSGAVMALDYFAHDEVHDNFFAHIQDRDLWKFEIPNTKEFHAGLSSYPKDFETWHKIIGSPGGYSKLIFEGAAILRSFNQTVSSIISSTKREMTINGHKGLVCNANGMFASDIGNLLAQESGTYGATYYSNSRDETIFSLRSIGEFDVSAIAKLFGGSGHRNAAGFKLTHPQEAENGVVLWNLNSELSNE